jgi:predicted acyltransferase
MSTTDTHSESIPTGARVVPAAPPAPAARLASLDQFRGYTVAGMFVVNFLGSFAVTPALLKHHNTYCSYADTIMPQFLFAVGFAFRLTFGRRAREQGLAAAYRRVARRLAMLALVAVVLYTLGAGWSIWGQLRERGFLEVLGELAKRHWFQTLLHIAVTSLWILPVIRAGAAVRVGWMILSAAAHVGLSAWFNFAWVNAHPKGIDGGPLGFLTWAIPALIGTLACDAFVGGAGRPRVGKLLAWSGILMALGYGLSCFTRLYDVPPARRNPPPAELADSPVLFSPEALRGRDLPSLLAEPPFVPPPGPSERQGNYWMMSQRSGTVSYLTFAAGFSLAVFVLFHLGCDRLGWRLGLFRTLGTNALAAYILGGMVEEAVQPFVPRDAPGWEVAAAFALFFACAYLLARLLEKKGLLLRL